MNFKNLTKEQRELRRRILDVSYEANASHIGSCLSTIDLISGIYQIKKATDRFILSNGHAGVALYVVLEKKGIIKASLKDFHVHPDRNPAVGIDVSTGSLGQGLPIAVGMALADKKKKIFTILSDGECTQGSIWESLKIAHEQKLSNLIIFVNANGWGAYDPISVPGLTKRLRGFCPSLKIIDGHNPHAIGLALKHDKSNEPNVILAKTTSDQFPFLKGQDAHYYVMKDEDYDIAKELLNG